MSSFWDNLKDAVTKTTLANISAFLVVLALIYYATFKATDETLLKEVGLIAFGYFFGARDK